MLSKLSFSICERRLNVYALREFTSVSSRPQRSLGIEITGLLQP